MVKQKTVKVTISLPREYLDYVDRLARTKSTTRSGLFAALVEAHEEGAVQVLMEEGYRDMAEENISVAESEFSESSETIRKYSEWDEESDGQAR